MSQTGLKITSNSSTSGPEAEPTAEVMYTTVYTFVIYDHDKGATVIYPRMATRPTIATMRGKVNEESAWVVDVNDLDDMGFYAGQDGASTNP